MTEPPVPLVERLLQQRVSILLKDSRRISGRLLGADEHLNLVLDEVDEATEERTRHLGRVVLRGSNVVTLSASAAKPGKPA
jgi:small nuclear ribonucleoprotein